MWLATERMAPEHPRLTYLSKAFSTCASSSRSAQSCSNFTKSGYHIILRTFCILSFSSLHFILCCGKLRVCSSSSFANARASHFPKKFQLLSDKSTLQYVPSVSRRVGSGVGIFFIDDDDDQPSNTVVARTTEIHSSLNRDPYSTVSANSKDQKEALRLYNKVHITISSNGEASTSAHHSSLQRDSSLPFGVEAKCNLVAPQKKSLHFFHGNNCTFCTSNAHEHRVLRAANISAFQNSPSRPLRRGENEIILDCDTSSKQRYLQHTVPTSSTSAPVSPAHPGVSVLGRVGQNAEINGEYKLVMTDAEKGFLFKKSLQSFSEATPLYIFSLSRAPLQNQEHDHQLDGHQQQHQRSPPLFWAIGEVPYVNERVRAFAVSDAVYPDLVKGIWSVFEQQNNETVLVPDKFVIVVRVGCNNGALDGNEIGMDCGGSCETLCENMRNCQLPRALPAGYALGSCPLDGVLQHGEGCTYKCPLGWKESGALGRVCYDGTLLEIRRGPGCEEAFSSIIPHAQQCQFLLLEGAPSKKEEREARTSRALTEEAKGRHSAGNDKVRGEGVVQLSTGVLKGTRRVEREQPGQHTVTLSHERAGRARQERDARRDGHEGEIVAPDIATGVIRGSRMAAGEGELLAREERTEAQGRMRRRKGRARDVEMLKGRGKRTEGTGGEGKETASLASAGTSETAGIRMSKGGNGAQRRRRTEEPRVTTGGSNAEEAREAAAADIRLNEEGTDATPVGALKRAGGEIYGDFTEEEEAPSHVCNGLFIMHAVRGTSGQRAVFWQRDADGVLIQLYWEDGYWVCASFDKDVEYGYVWDPFPSKLVQAPSTPLLGSRGVWAVEESPVTRESATSLHCVDPLRSAPKQACVAVYFSRWRNPSLQGYFFSVLPPSADGRPRYINEKQLLLHWTPLGYWVAGDVEDQTAALALTFSPSRIPPLTGWRSWNAESRRWEKEEKGQVQCIVADDRVLPPQAAAGIAAGATGAAAGGGASHALPSREEAYADLLESSKLRNSHYGFPAQIVDVTRTVIRSADGRGPLLEGLLNFDAGLADTASSAEKFSRLPLVPAATLPATAAEASSPASELSAAEIGSESCAHVLLEGGRGFGESCNGVWSKPQPQQQQQNSFPYMYKLSVDSRVLYLYHAGGQWRCTADGATLLGYSDNEKTRTSRNESGGTAVMERQARGNWLDGKRYVRGSWTFTCIAKATPVPQCDELSVSNFVEAAEVFNGKWTRSNIGGPQHYTKPLPGAVAPPPLLLLHQQQEKALLHLYYHPLSLWVIGSSVPSSSNGFPKFSAYAMKSHSGAPPSGLWTVFDGNLNRAVLHLVDVECINRLASKLV